MFLVHDANDDDNNEHSDDNADDDAEGDDDDEADHQQDDLTRQPPYGQNVSVFIATGRKLAPCLLCQNTGMFSR